MSTKSEQIVVRCTSSQRERWEHYAQKDKRTLADWIRLQVDNACDELDEQESKKKK